jgi:hypothetical protein
MARSFRRVGLASLWFPAALIVLVLLALPSAGFLILHLFGKEPALNGWLKDRFGVTYYLPTPWWTGAALRGVGGDSSYKNTDRVGDYEATWAGGQRFFAVNLLDADESNIQPRDAIKIGEQRLAAGPSRRQTYDTWKWIALAALVLLVLEWAAYHRRLFF